MRELAEGLHLTRRTGQSGFVDPISDELERLIDFPGIASHPIVTATAGECVIAAPLAVDTIVPLTSQDDIVVGSTKHAIIAVPTHQDVAPPTTDHQVVPIKSGDPVITVTPIDTVVGAATSQQVVSGGSQECRGTRELSRIDAVVSGTTLEPRPFDSRKTISPLAVKPVVGEFEVDIAHLTQQVDPALPLEMIVTSPTTQPVVATTANHTVVVVVTIEHIVAAATVEPIVPGSSVELIITGATDQHIVSTATGKRDRTSKTGRVDSVAVVTASQLGLFDVTKPIVTRSAR